MRFHLEGVIPAMVTPFERKTGNVDYDKAAELSIWLADKGVHGLFLCGTTGEGFLMQPEERMLLLEKVLNAVGKRVKIIAHTGCIDTRTTIALTRHAQEAGAVAAGAITPFFFTFDDASIKAHYKAVAAAVKGFPLLMYNLPGCAKNVLSPELILELSEIENIVGVKDSGGNFASLSALLGKKSKDFNVINGTDEYTYQALLSGANGSVSSTANVVPHLFLSIFNNVRKHNLAAAWKAQLKLTEACELFHYGKMVAYYKEGLRLSGFNPGPVRAPQRELTKAESKAFAKRIEASGVLG